MSDMMGERNVRSNIRSKELNNADSADTGRKGEHVLPDRFEVGL